MTAPAVISTAPFVTLHALQAFPPSLLNRDDNNTVKQIVYGGVTRVRVSSSASKRAIRVAMRDAALDDGQYGLRTTRFPALTVELLVHRHQRAAIDAVAKTAAVFAELKLKTTKAGNTAAPIFASPQFPSSAAIAIDSHWDRIGTAVPADVTALVRAALDVRNTIDLALFGRMLAEIPASRVDGAAGVSHSFSVDPASVEPDFWSMVDDAAGPVDVTATNLGESSLTAPVLYRSAYLDRRQLRRNLANAADVEALAVESERSFIEWFVRAVPKAKQRSTVAATLPSLVVATCGSQVLSGAAAFITPINGPGVVNTAAQALLASLARADLVVHGQSHVVLSTDPHLESAVLGPHHAALRDFVDAVVAQ